MKKTLKIGLLLVASALVMTSCNCYKKMAKKVETISAKANPELLSLKGQEIYTNVTVEFAPNFVQKTATVRITPVLVFAGGEIEAAPRMIQGDKVSDNYTVISYASGGSITQDVRFPYDERAKKSKLELRFAVKCGSGAYDDLTVITVAEGLSTVQNLANWTSETMIMADNYKKVNTLSHSANVMYEVNSSYVAPRVLNTEQLKLLKEFVDESGLNERATIGAIEAKGYASPEGPTDHNNKLSKDRSQSAKNAVSRQLGNNLSYNEASFGEDWDGFKELVEASNMPDKNLILQVLKMYNSPTQRENEIKNMAQVYEVLKKDILPQLRRTQLVANVNISGKTDQELASAAKSNIASLNLEETLYAATLTKDPAEMTAIYKSAADRFNDERAYNNYGVALAKNGDFSAAKKMFEKAASVKKADAITNNLGVVAMAEGDVEAADKYFRSINTKEARANMNLLALANGDYSKAASGLSGYNLAVAEVCNGNLSAAKTALGTNQNANADYLRAVIAMREANTSSAISNLKSAISKEAAMKEYAQNDIEFVKIAGQY